MIRVQLELLSHQRSNNAMCYRPGRTVGRTVERPQIGHGSSNVQMDLWAVGWGGVHELMEVGSDTLGLSRVEALRNLLDREGGLPAQTGGQGEGAHREQNARPSRALEEPAKWNLGRTTMIRHGRTRGNCLCAPKRICMLWISYLLLSAFGAANAVTLVVLPFADKSESTNQPQWEVGIPFLLKEQLRQIDPIRILPDGSVEFGPDDTADYGYQQVHEQSDWSVGDSRKLGEAVEAQVVVDGSYAIHGGRCSISLRLVHVLTGASSGFLTVQGAGWFEAICEAQKLILDQLHLVPGREAERRMSTPPTKSPAALEAFARGLAGKNNGAPVSAIEKDLRNAIALDGGFVMAQEALALVLSLEGHDEEALKLVAPIVRKDGHSATGHYILATVYSSQDRNGEA